MSAVSCIHTPPPTYSAGVNAFSNISTYQAAFASGSNACSTYGTCISSSSISTVVPNVHAPPTGFSAPSLGSMIARPRPTRCTVHPSSGSTLGPLSAEGPLGSHSTTARGCAGSHSRLVCFWLWIHFSLKRLTSCSTSGNKRCGIFLDHQSRSAR